MIAANASEIGNFSGGIYVKKGNAPLMGDKGAVYDEKLPRKPEGLKGEGINALHDFHADSIVALYEICVNLFKESIPAKKPGYRVKVI